MSGRVVGIVMLLACLGSPATAADPVEEARGLYRKALSHFAIGEFGEAADAYQEAYKRKPDAALLYNAAQASRLAGRHERALVLYRNYVNLYPHEKNIPDVEEHVLKLQQLVALAASTRTAPPTGTAEPARNVPEGQPATQERVTAAPTPVAIIAVTASPPAQHRPLYKKAWFWGAIGGAVVAVGVGVGLGLGLTRHTDNSNLPEFGPGSPMGLAIGGAR